MGQMLAECANQASSEVNERRFGKGQRPTREQCQEVVERDSRDNPVTRAMKLGSEQHQVALACAREKLAAAFPEHFALEPHYLYDAATGQARFVPPEQVAEWLRDGLFHLLPGALVPDVVLHGTGDPRRVQAVFDFKFPCPSGNPLQWGRHPHHGSSQGELYEKALGVKRARLVAPGYGVQ
ncbi:hypothetical protein [Corallococcus llansteffanensis]|uniref:hypothetical protein n=1 Tax=Corallococcus llansteffanensis TaxID=2316731 RepID=UPI001FC95971|nr:hypothetical protein [Corallococcus llansteffanensis]